MAEDNRQPAPVSATPEKRSVGETLRAARNAQSLTLEQIATELRIELPQLEALENDRFERIGVPVFVKGYLRQYGMRLGVDPRDLLMQYYQQNSLKEVQVQPSKTIRLRDERQITVWVIAALAILVVIAGLAAWWVGVGGSPVATSPSTAPTGGDAKPAPAAPTPAAATPTPAALQPATPSGGPASGAAAAPAESAPSSAPPAPVTTPAPSGGAAVPAGTTTLAVATPTPSSRGSVDRIKPTSPPSAVALAAAPPTAATPAAAAPPSATPAAAATDSDDGVRASLVVPLEITFEQESWAEVTDARGERMYYGLGTAGKHAQMRGEPPFAVVLGNASGVKIVIDGEDFAVPAKGKPGEYARFSVNVVSD
jgi:cytoskeleton protein RodZ